METPSTETSSEDQERADARSSSDPAKSEPNVHMWQPLPKSSLVEGEAECFDNIDRVVKASEDATKAKELVEHDAKQHGTEGLSGGGV